MKIKKALAFIAAFSMLSVTGVNAFAEEKLSAYKNSGIITLGTAMGFADSKEFSCDNYNFVAELTSNPGGLVVDKYITIYKYENDGSKTETNISGKNVCTLRNGENPGLEENFSLDYILSINDNSISINSTFYPWEYDEAQYESVNYVYDESTNSFVEPGSITTPTTTTTTTSLMEGIKVDEKVKNFELDGVAFYAQRMYEYKERVSGKLVEYDKYDYVSIFLADGTPTNIQEEFVFVEPGCTGGWAGYSISDYVSISGNNLVITHKGDSDLSITYTYDKLTNKFVKASTVTTNTSKTTTTTITTTTKATITTNTSNTTGKASGSTTNGTANSPITADKMLIPAVAGSAALVLGAVIYVTKKRK